jgi:hypothetical protein
MEPVLAVQARVENPYLYLEHLAQLVPSRPWRRTSEPDPSNPQMSRNQIPYLFQGTTLEPSTFHIGQGVALDA